MPKPKNKKRVFIDKKNAVSFQLVHRSQQVRQRQPTKTQTFSPPLINDHLWLAFAVMLAGVILELEIWKLQNVIWMIVGGEPDSRVWFPPGRLYRLYYQDIVSSIRAFSIQLMIIFSLTILLITHTNRRHLNQMENGRLISKSLFKCLTWPEENAKIEVHRLHLG